MAPESRDREAVEFSSPTKRAAQWTCYAPQYGTSAWRGIERQRHDLGPRPYERLGLLRCRGRGQGLELRLRPGYLPTYRRLARRSGSETSRRRWATVCSACSRPQPDRACDGGGRSVSWHQDVRRCHGLDDGNGRRGCAEQLAGSRWSAAFRVPQLRLSRDGPSQPYCALLSPGSAGTFRKQARGWGRGFLLRRCSAYSRFL